MVKTHESSFFTLLTLDQIRANHDVILQITDTETIASDTKRSLYLCEVVNSNLYGNEHLSTVSAELVRVNKDRDRLQRKIERLEKLNRDLDTLITRMKSDTNK